MKRPMGAEEGAQVCVNGSWQSIGPSPRPVGPYARRQARALAYKLLLVAAIILLPGAQAELADDDKQFIEDLFAGVEARIQALEAQNDELGAELALIRQGVAAYEQQRVQDRHAMDRQMAQMAGQLEDTNTSLSQASKDAGQAAARLDKVERDLALIHEAVLKIRVPDIRPMEAQVETMAADQQRLGGRVATTNTMLVVVVIAAALVTVLGYAKRHGLPLPALARKEAKAPDQEPLPEDKASAVGAMLAMERQWSLDDLSQADQDRLHQELTT